MASYRYERDIQPGFGEVTLGLGQLERCKGGKEIGGGEKVGHLFLRGGGKARKRQHRGRCTSGQKRLHSAVLPVIRPRLVQAVRSFIFSSSKISAA